jgi:hypothetical protein
VIVGTPIVGVPRGFSNRGLIMRLNVSTNVLRALVDFLDSANSRFILGSVRVVGSEGSDKVSLVATDGRILAHLELPCDVLSCDVDFGISGTILKKLKAGKGDTIIDWGTNSQEYYLRSDGVSVAFEPSFDRFPRWQQVIPHLEDMTIGAASLCPRLMGTACKMFQGLEKLTYDKNVDMRVYTQRSSATVLVGEVPGVKATIVVMPKSWEK